MGYGMVFCWVGLGMNCSSPWPHHSPLSSTEEGTTIHAKTISSRLRIIPGRDGKNGSNMCVCSLYIVCLHIHIYIYTYMMCMNISKHQKFYYWILWDQNMTLILDDSCRNLKLWNNDDPPRDLGSPIFRQIIVMISMKMCKLNMFTIPDLPDFDTQDTNNHANSLNLDWIL